MISPASATARSCVIPVGLSRKTTCTSCRRASSKAPARSFTYRRFVCRSCADRSIPSSSSRMSVWSTATSSRRSTEGPATAASWPGRSVASKARDPERSAKAGDVRPAAASRSRSCSGETPRNSSTANRSRRRGRKRSSSNPSSPCTTRWVGRTTSPGSSMPVRNKEPNSIEERGERASGRSPSRTASIVSYLWCPSAMYSFASASAAATRRWASGSVRRHTRWTVPSSVRPSSSGAADSSAANSASTRRCGSE